MSMTISYSVFASGLASVAGAPVPGFLAGGAAMFGLGSDDWSALPDLRRWIEKAGGSIDDETGTPAPAPLSTIDDNGLYAVSLGPTDAEIVGLQRALRPCPECALPVTRLERVGLAPTSDSLPDHQLLATARASWLATPELLAGLDRAALADGLVRVVVHSPGGPRVACWPERALASHVVDRAGVRRCGTCWRNVVTGIGEEAVPRYSLGLFVEAPSRPRGWWWHARFGQHLPILSGEVVRHLGQQVDLSALPAITEPDAAFLPEEYR